MPSFFNRPNILIFLLCLVAASIVWSNTNGHSIFHVISSKSTFVLGVFFVADKNILQKLKSAFSNKMVWLYFGVFIWHAVWMNFSADKNMAYNAIEKKLSFIVFPLIFAGEKSLGRREVERIIFIFVVSCWLALFYCEVIGNWNYFHSPIRNIDNLIYELLASPIMHPGYLSNFFIFSIIWLSLPWIGYQVKYEIPNWIRIVLILFFVIFIGQLTSKTAFLIFLFYIAWMLFKLLNSKLTAQKKILFSGIMLTSVFTIIGIVRLFLWGRFTDFFHWIPINNQIKFNQSTMARAAAAFESFQKVKPVWYKGYGTGMANQMLFDQFTEKGYTYLADPKLPLHCHNQFMRTWLDLGFFGLLYIVMVFAITWWFFKVKKEWAGMWMVVITFVNCATDDMLDIQSGIVFFLFFISLLYWGSRKQYESAYQAL